MLRFKTNFYLLFFLSTFYVLTLTSNQVKAGNVGPIKDSLYGSQIVENTSFNVINDGYLFYPFAPDWNTGTVHKKIMDQVTFSFNSVGTTHISQAFVITLDIEVKYWNEQNNNYNNPITLPPVTLEIQYDPKTGVKYKDKDIYYFEGGHQVEVKIIDINCLVSGTQVQQIPSGIIERLKLEASITSQRFEPLSTNLPSFIWSTTTNQPQIVNGNEYQARWSALDGAEAYDLEWTFINDYNGYDANGSISYKDPSDLKFDFRNNSTRIRTNGLFYNIPLIYEHGYLIFRVRAIGKAEPDYVHDVQGEWSTSNLINTVYDIDSKSKYFIQNTDVHEGDKKNWQYTVNFAEEGKNKGIVNYMDGTLRNRQVVTKISSENKAIVGEVIYDEAGRPAVEILPAPANNNTFKYYQSFNQNEYNQPYSNKDIPIPTPSNCLTPAEVMSTGSGASQYYSDQNPETNKQQAYVPDANRYPFSQTQYAMDNTGRVRAKSGVGIDHKLGSGHETRYFYGTPAPAELQRLFGTDIGNAVYYKKNLIVDANGQVSISYLDPKGNTIATGLAGSSPISLTQLTSNQATNINIDLLRNDTNINKTALISNYTLLVTGNQINYDFSYTVDPGKINDECYNNICYKCKYYLSLYITDACGEQVYSLERHPLGVLDIIDTVCESQENTMNLPPAFSKILNVGSYNITKILTVDEDAIDTYVEAFIQHPNNSCIQSYQSFLDKEMERIDTTNCNITCTDCQSRITNNWQYTNASQNNYITKDRYEELLAQCDVLCDSIPTDICGISLKTLKADVSPGGQYAEYKDSITCDTNVASFPLSVLNNTGSNYKLGNNWKNPKSPYIEKTGNFSFIEVINGKPGTDAGKTITLEDGRIVVEPQHLTDVKDFIKYWKPSWAASLVAYHPEYNLYKWCQINAKSNAFDERMLSTRVYSDAIHVDNKLLSLTNSTVAGCSLSINQILKEFDPYFGVRGQGADQVCEMQKAMNNFLTIEGNTYNIFQVAVASVNCSTEKTAAAYHSCITSHNFGTNPATADMEWEVFRSFYISLKQKLQAKKRAEYALKNECYNACIGNKNYNPFENFDFLNLDLIALYRWVQQPCGALTAKLFHNKTARFPVINQLIDIKTDIYGDPEYVAARSKAHVERELYNKCGKCPKAMHLENMLSTLASKNKLLVDNTILNSIPEISTEIRDMFPSTTYDYIWRPAVYASNKFTVNIKRLDGFCCNINLAPVSGTIDWTKVVSFSGIEVIAPYTFYIYAEMGNDSNFIKLEGSTECLDIYNCTFPPKCKESQVSFDLRNIFNALLHSPSGTSNGFILGADLDLTKFNEFLTDDILASLNPEQGNVITSWDVLPRTKTILNPVITIDPETGEETTTYEEETVADPNNLSIQIKNGTSFCDLKFIIPVPYKDVYTFEDFESVLFVEADPNTTPGIPNQNAKVTVKTKTGKIIIIDLETSCYIIGQCGNPEKKCDVEMEEGDETRRNLLTFLNSITQNYNLVVSSGFDLETFDPFTPLKDVITGTNRAWTGIVENDGNGKKLTGSFNSTNGCTITLKCPDNRIQFQDISYFKGLIAVPSGMDNALTNDFTIEAYTKCGSRITLAGIINCTGSGTGLQIANCKKCPSSIINSKLIANDGFGDCRDGLCKPVKKMPSYVAKNPCIEYLKNVAKLNAKTAYNTYLDSLRIVLKARFTKQCLATIETFNTSYNTPEHHYTLYYYDQANNLIKTIPPKGFDNAGTGNHILATRYRYNSLNQLIEQNTPDGGKTTFFYDALGRMVISQNAKQLPINKYSYTQYDALGRITEVGEITSAIAIVRENLMNAGYYDQWLANKDKKQITRTYYDVPLAGVNTYFVDGQQNLRSRVASTTLQEVDGSNYDFASHYSYDVHGNVQTLIQENKGLSSLGHSIKKIDYEYDLISGKVNKVFYQKEKADQFIHRYSYDADNRIVMVETSKDDIIWDRDGKYFYYQHGPLARTEIGEHKVQGIDYAYTIQGWLKGVNSNTLSANNDMGNDGFHTSSAYNIINGLSTINVHEKIARDAFGFTLSYYKDDYKSVSLTDKFEADLAPGGVNSGIETASKNLYNGNIRHMVSAIGKLMPSGQALGTVYQYDQLNRIKNMNVFNNLDTSQNKWLSGSGMNDYHTEYSYDDNGNIISLLRNGTTQYGTPLAMDNMVYNYISGTNKLKYVTDDPLINNNYTTDIDNQATDNYDYDAIGNLKQDKQEEISLIEWTVYGKIKKITRTSVSKKPDLEFFYGPDGNRVAKVAKYGTDAANWKYTAYVRDAQGNVMATYTHMIEKRIEPTQNDYPAVMTALKNEIGTTNFDSYIPNTYCPQGWFITNLKTSIQTNNYTATLIQPYSSVWYAENDATVRADVLSQVTDDNLAAAVLRQNPEIVLQHYFQQSGIPAIQLIQSFVCNDATLFMTYMHDEASGSIDYLYDYFYPGQPHPSVPDMINDLASQQSCTDLAQQIDYYNSTYWTGGVMCINVIKQYPATDIYNNMIGLYGGSFTAMRSYLESHPSIIYMLYADDPNTILSVVLLLSDNDKLDIVAQHDPCNLSQSAINTSRTMVEGVINDNYNITGFLGDVKANHTLTVYKNMMISVYGVAGEMQEKLFLDEQHVYGSSRLGTVTASKQLVMKDYDGTLNMQTGLGIPLVIYQDISAEPIILGPNKYFTRYIGNKRYELSNHLGNVLAVVTDKKVSVPNSGNTTIAWYEPEVISATNYYPFGSPMPGQEYSIKEPMVNEDFNSGSMTGWAPMNNATISISNGRLKIEGSQYAAGAYKIYNVKVNKRYRIRYKADIGNSQGLYVIIRSVRANNTSSGYFSQTYPTASGSYEITFTSNNTDPKIDFEIVKITPAGVLSHFYIDDLIIEELNDSAYRYGFNGKENDNEVKGEGNSVDFGARIYDPRIGQFLSTDAYTSFTPGESPYIYAGNSPIRFVDVEGNFKMDAFFVQQYPTLAKMVQYYLPMLKDNPDVRDAWIKVTGLTGDDFDRMVTYGQGPWVTPTRPELASIMNQNDPRATLDNGQFSPEYPENLFISNTRLTELENAMSAALRGGNANEVARKMFFVSMSIMHEFTHYGVFHNFGAEKAAKIDVPYGTDQGAEWERRALEQFSYKGGKFGNAPDMKAFNNFFDNKLNSVNRIGMTLSERSWYNTSVFRNRPATSGQTGDPSIKKSERAARKKQDVPHKSSRHL